MLPGGGNRAATLPVDRPRRHGSEGPGGDIYLAHAGWGLTANGELVISTERDAYRLEYLDLDGRLLRVVERELEACRRTEEDKGEIRETTRLFINGKRRETVFHLLDTEPVVSWVRARHDGSLMVGTCLAERELPEGVVLRFDVHAPDGSLRKEVRLAGDVGLGFDRVLLLGDGRAVILSNYNPATRDMRGTGREGHPVREGDEVFEVVVCDLVERSYAIAGEISSTSNSRRSPSSP